MQCNAVMCSDMQCTVIQQTREPLESLCTPPDQHLAQSPRRDAAALLFAARRAQRLVHREPKVVAQRSQLRVDEPRRLRLSRVVERRDIPYVPHHRHIREGRNRC